jgi:hypothetical protein
VAFSKAQRAVASPAARVNTTIGQGGAWDLYDTADHVFQKDGTVITSSHRAGHAKVQPSTIDRVMASN